MSFHNLKSTPWLLAIAFLLSSCSLVFGSSFEPNVVIPEDHYRIDNLRCEPQPGTSVVDGESVDTTFWVARGEFVNLLDTGTGSYDVRLTIRLDTGESRETPIDIFPLAVGESSEFERFGFAETDYPGATITDCSEVIVYDSVLNH